jgi:hypothetical protein
VPEPADAADALAIAICHIHTAQTLAAFKEFLDEAGVASRRFLALALALPALGQAASAGGARDSSGFLKSQIFLRPTGP